MSEFTVFGYLDTTPQTSHPNKSTKMAETVINTLVKQLDKDCDDLCDKYRFSHFDVSETLGTYINL